jgi:hypothetical protein
MRIDFGSDYKGLTYWFNRDVFLRPSDNISDGNFYPDFVPRKNVVIHMYVDLHQRASE